MYNYIGVEPRREAMHWQFGEMKFGEMKRNTSNWSIYVARVWQRQLGFLVIYVVFSVINRVRGNLEPNIPKTAGHRDSVPKVWPQTGNGIFVGHVTKGQTRNPNTLRTQYLENSWICYLATRNQAVARIADRTASPSGVTWRHRSRDHLIPHMLFPIDDPLEPSLYL